MYKNWLPAGEETQRRHPRHYDDVGAILEAGGGAVAKDFPDLDRSEAPTPSAGPVHCTASAKKEPPFHLGQGVGVAKEEFITKAPACKLCEA